MGGVQAQERHTCVSGREKQAFYMQHVQGTQKDMVDRRCAVSTTVLLIWKQAGRGTEKAERTCVHTANIETLRLERCFVPVPHPVPVPPVQFKKL